MTAKKMNLPEEIPRFRDRTLIFCFGKDLARPFYVHGREVDEMEIIHTVDTEFEYSDKEAFNSSNGGSSPGSDKHNKEHYAHVFMNYFLDKLHGIEAGYKFEKIVVLETIGTKGLTQDKWPKHLMEKTHFIVGNFHKHSPLEIFHKILKEAPLLFEVKA